MAVPSALTLRPWTNPKPQTLPLPLPPLPLVCTLQPWERRADRPSFVGPGRLATCLGGRWAGRHDSGLHDFPHPTFCATSPSPEDECRAEGRVQTTSAPNVRMMRAQVGFREGTEGHEGTRNEKKKSQPRDDRARALKCAQAHRSPLVIVASAMRCFLGWFRTRCRR